MRVLTCDRAVTPGFRKEPEVQQVRASHQQVMVKNETKIYSFRLYGFLKMTVMLSGHTHLLGYVDLTTEKTDLVDFVLFCSCMVQNPRRHQGPCELRSSGSPCWGAGHSELGFYGQPSTEEPGFSGEGADSGTGWETWTVSLEHHQKVKKC